MPKLRVSALCIHDGHALFIEHKSFAPDDPALPSTYWILPGGVVEPRETLHEAVRREMLEETGLSCEVGEMVFVKELLYPEPDADNRGSRHHSISIGFSCQVTGGELITGKDPELADHEQVIIEARWLPIDRLGEYEIYPPFLYNLVPSRASAEAREDAPRFYDTSV